MPTAAAAGTDRPPGCRGRALPGGLRRSAVAVAATAVLVLSWAPGVAGAGTPALADPAASISPHPDYLDLCAPAGIDTSTTCLRITLAAIDHARAKEHLGPMRLPASFPHLSVAEQLFVAVDAERVDRGLAPFAGLSASLDAGAQRAASKGQLPKGPGSSYRRSDAEWIGEIANGLDADFDWVYDDGLNAGVPACDARQRSGCWADRGIVLDRLGGATDLVMGAALDPAGDRSAGQPGGPSLAATFAVARRPPPTFVFTWAEAQAEIAAGTLSPLDSIPADESDTGIADPPDNVRAHPDYPRICAPSGLDGSARCNDAVLAAINHARALEGVRPMVLPTNFGQLSLPDQLFVVIDLERVDRGLSPFVGLTAALDRDAQKGADTANDPPDPGPRYLLFDGEWAGGSANALDAVYGWMYDDGFNSGNLDCLKIDAAGCWGHRKGILDNFGSGSELVMGTAVDPTGDTNKGDVGGTSMAATLAVTSGRTGPLLYRWSEAQAAMPPGDADG